MNLIEGMEVSCKENMLLSIWVTENIFKSFIIILAVWTVLTQGALLFSFSFLTLSLLFTLAIIFLGVMVFLVKRKTYTSRPSLVSDYSTLIMLSVLVVIGAALAFLSIRFHTDDVFYTSRVVYYLKYIHEPMQPVYHHHALPNVTAMPAFICHTVEFFWAYGALIFNQNFLDIYHLLVPVLGGMLIPLVWYLLLSKFSGNSLYAALGAAGICAFLTIDGGVNRSFANFTLYIWIGKVFLMSVLIPLLIAYSLDFFHRQNFQNWGKLFLLGVAATGFSTTAIFLFPFLSLVLSAGYFIANIKEQNKLRIIFSYYSAFFYVGLIAFYLFLKINPSDYAFLGSAGWPDTFKGQYELVFQNWFSFLSIIFYLSIILSLILLEAPVKKFLLGWLGALFIFFLNPVMMPLIAKYFTTNNNYWRIFYLLPFPLLLGVLIASLCEKKKLPARYAYGFFIFLIATAAVINFIPARLSIFRQVDFAFAKHKIDPKIESEVIKIISVSPPGIMLAPIELSNVIPMYNPDYPQIVVRKDMYLYEALAQNQFDFVNCKMRVRAADFISEYNDDGFNDLVSLLKTNLNAVVLKADMKNLLPSKQALSDNNFKLVKATDLYLVYIKEVK
jgi:hypothetical protein